MDTHNKNLQDKLNSPPSLPKKFDWENMEEGIYSKMETLRLAESSNEKQRRRLFFLFFLLIGAHLCVVLHMYNNTTKVERIENNVEAFTLSSENNLNSGYEANPAKRNTGDEDSIDNFNQQRTLAEETLSAVSEPEQMNIRYRKAKAKNVKNMDAVLDNFDTQSEISHERTAQKNEAYSKENENRTDIVLAQMEEKNDLFPLPTLPFAHLSSNSSELSHKEGLILLQRLFIETDETEKELPFSKSSVGLASGISLWNLGYNSQVPERAAYERSLMSFTAQLDYHHFVSDRFFLSTGLVYQRLESRLDWSKTIENFPITLEDVILQRQTDALTGTIVENRGQIVVEVEAQRKVRHHNQTTLLQMPIGIGMAKSLGAFNWTVEAGTSMNILGNSQGRLLDQGEIVNYNGTNNEYFQGRWKVNGYIQSGLDYEITKSWRFSALAGYQKAISNWSLKNGTQMRPQSVNVLLGLRYFIH